MTENSPSLSYLEFRLATLAYAVAIETIKEIHPVSLLTPLPNSFPHVCGLMNLRGQVLPVIDLNVRLGNPKTQISRESCVIVVDSDEGAVGLLVDGVSRVVTLGQETILPPPETCHLQDRSLVTALAQDGQRLITLLNIASCLSRAEVRPAAAAKEQTLQNQSFKLLG